MIPSLGVGQLDVGGGTVSAGLFNAVARGIPIKMVAPQSRHDIGACSLYVMLRRDLIESGAVTDYTSLRGRRIATPARASSPTSSSPRLLRKLACISTMFNSSKSGVPGHDRGLR